MSLGVDFVPDINPATFFADESGSFGILFPSKVEASMVPPGYSCGNIVKLLHHQEIDEWDRSEPGYHKRKIQYGDELIKRAEKAIPNLRVHIIYRQYASPTTFARYARTTDGAIYGLAADEWRPSIKTPIRGLYLAGAEVSLRPGVEDVEYSGMMVAEIVMTHRRSRWLE